MPHSSPLSRRSWLGQCALAGWGSLFSSPWLAGCGRAPPPPEPPTRPAPGYRLGLIGRRSDSVSFQAAAAAATQRATEFSASLQMPVEVRVLAPDRDDPAAQAAWIEQLVREEFAGIALEVSDPASLRQAVANANSQGVPVACFNFDLPESQRFVFLGVDEDAVGEALMSRCIALLEEQRPESTAYKIAILGGGRRSSLFQKRIEAAQTESVRHEKVRLVGTYQHSGSPGDALKTLIAAHRDEGPMDGWVLLGDWPLATGEEFPWQPGEVVCVAMEALPEQLARLKAGELQMLLARPYSRAGSRVVELLVDRISRGNQPAGEYEWLECSEVPASKAGELEEKWRTWLAPPQSPPS